MIFWSLVCNNLYAKLQEYDATCLVKKFNDVSATILIDQVWFDVMQSLPATIFIVCLSFYDNC